jgi:hypothetical protein
MKFEDLVFEPNPLCGGIGAKMKIADGYVISVIAGHSADSTPRKNLPSPEDFTQFEIAILNSNHQLVTEDFFPECNDEVLSFQSREDINFIIEALS